jgi:hypothetical protein
MRLLRSSLLLVLAAPAFAATAPEIAVPGPLCISLVGSNAGVPAAAYGQFTITARDLANQPIPGAVIVVDFGECLDVTICADQLDPAASVDCAHKTVTKVAGADGRVEFIVLGGSNGAGNASTLLNGGRLYVNGRLYGSPSVSAYDLDGSGGVGASDLSAWLTDFGSGQNYGRSDYDCSGGIGASDLGLWLTAFASTTMAQSCTSQCP